MSGTIILIPVYNDWEAAALLLHDLDAALAQYRRVAVLFVDDGSSEPLPPGFGRGPFSVLDSVDVLRLRRNLGHQRAIATGLVHVYGNTPCEAVIVMDCDGEDRPRDIPALLERFDRENRQSIVFAARSKRLERPLFRGLYHVYRWLHWLITGDTVRVGNFSIIPFESLAKLVVIPEIWYHYAAAVIRSRLRFATIPIARGQRQAGKSKMNFIALLLHGLSAFFVYGDIVGARLLVGIALALLIEAALIGAGIAIRLTNGLSFAALATVLAILLGIVLLQAVPIALILVFTVIGSRVNIGFLPIRDCPYFVSGIERIYPKA